MPAIKRVLIKGSSGFGPIGEAYRDRITLERSGIRYDYAPLEPSESNMPLRWSYRTSNPAFAELYDCLTRLLPSVLDRPDDLDVTDIGGIEFSVTYDDGTRAKRLFWLTAESFQECFAVIRRLLPSFEEVPHVLR